jgi:aerobic-type carbon monoxide dehydrogenase small subunit (CoxS/CutS family)
MATITLTVNGRLHTVDVEPDMPLLWVLRDRLGLTGTKFGCGKALCGACTVIMDGMAIRSCVIPVSSVKGKKILTIEGLAGSGKLHPIQEAFARHDALQCGFCTPGMILNAYSLLLSNPEPTRQEIIDGMEYNLCRCGAHTRIIRAIEEAAQEMKGAR